HHVQIARRTAGRARFAFTREPHALSGGDARGDAHRELPLLLHAPRAAAGGAGIGDDRAGAVALAAGAGHREEPLLVAQLSAPLALRAGGRPRAFGAAAARAGFTRLLPGNLQGGLGAPRRFLEGDLEVV